MKKFLAILILFLIISLSSASNYKHYGFSVKCAKCVENSITNPGIHINIAWRTTDPYKKENGKVYARYRCAGGCDYWAEIN